MSAEATRDEVRAIVRRHLERDAGDAAAARAVMHRFEAAYAAGDVDGIVACFSADIEWRLPTGRLLQGREASRAFLVERAADPSGPRFSDSRLAFFGDTVVQRYRVALPTAAGGTRELDGCDIYRLRDGLIATKDAYWKQVGADAAGPTPPSASARALVVPLRVAGAADASRLSDLVQRLAASPALTRACASGALKLELSVQPTAAAEAAPSTTAEAAPSTIAEAAPSSPVLSGVVTERDVRALPEPCSVAALAPRAVLTPLARDALRRRGITLRTAAEA